MSVCTIDIPAASDHDLVPAADRAFDVGVLDAVADLEALAAEATGVFFYVLGQDVLPIDDGYLALTHPGLDAAVEQQLRACGRWRGRRPAVAMNFAMIAGEARDRVGDAAEFSEELRMLTLGIVAHELAHVLERPAPYYCTRRLGSGRAGDYRRESIAAAVSAPASATAFPDLPPWAGHGPVWLRLSLHVAYRLGRAAGCDLGHWRRVVGGLVRAPWGRMVEALGDEPRRLLRLPIEHIKRHAMPRPYRKIWAEVLDPSRDGRAAADTFQGGLIS